MKPTDITMQLLHTIFCSKNLSEMEVSAKFSLVASISMPHSSNPSEESFLTVIFSIIQPQSPLIKPLPTLTQEILSKDRKIVAVTLELEGKLIILQIQQESSEISQKDKIQLNATIALDNSILPVINWEPL